MFSFYKVNLLPEDPSTVLWTLKPSEDTPQMHGHILEGLYSLTPADQCIVEAHDAQYVSRIWFTTPVRLWGLVGVSLCTDNALQVLTERVAPQIQELQLFTTAKNQGYGDEKQGMWTWFDVVVLESPKSNKPKTLPDGRALVWRSHDIHIRDSLKQEVVGPRFNKSLDPLLRRDDISFTSRLETSSPFASMLGFALGRPLLTMPVWWSESPSIVRWSDYSWTPS